MTGDLLLKLIEIASDTKSMSRTKFDRRFTSIFIATTEKAIEEQKIIVFDSIIR